MKIRHWILIWTLIVIFSTGFCLNTHWLIPKEAMWFMPGETLSKHYGIIEDEILMPSAIGTVLTPLILESFKNPVGGGDTIGIIDSPGNSKTIVDYRSTYIIKKQYWGHGDYFYCYKLQNTGN